MNNKTHEFRVCTINPAEPASRFQRVMNMATKAWQKMHSVLFRGEFLFISVENGIVVKLNRQGEIVERIAENRLSSDIFERLIASTQFRGNAVFAIYIADSIGYSGSVAVQMYKDLFQADMNRFEFFRSFTYALSLIGTLLLIAACCYFFPKTSPLSKSPYHDVS